MLPLSIVINFNVIEQTPSSLFSRLEGLKVCMFSLEGMKKAFRDGIVEAAEPVALSNPMFWGKQGVRFTGVLTAVIGVRH